MTRGPVVTHRTTTRHGRASQSTPSRTAAASPIRRRIRRAPDLRARPSHSRTSEPAGRLVPIGFSRETGPGGGSGGVVASARSRARPGRPSRARQRTAVEPRPDRYAGGRPRRDSCPRRATLPAGPDPAIGDERLALAARIVDPGWHADPGGRPQRRTGRSPDRPRPAVGSEPPGPRDRRIVVILEADAIAGSRTQLTARLAVSPDGTGPHSRTDDSGSIAYGRQLGAARVRALAELGDAPADRQRPSSGAIDLAERSDRPARRLPATVTGVDGAPARSPRPRVTPGRALALGQRVGVVEELDLDRLDRVGRLEAEDLAVERQLGLERADDVVGRARKPWSSPGEEQVRVRQAPLPERVDDLLGLGRRHDPVLGALQDQHGARDPLGEVERASGRGRAPSAPGTARSAARGSATRTCGSSFTNVSRSPIPK